MADACASPCELSPRDPIHRLCLTDPSYDSLLVCRVAAWLYHALMIGHREEVEEMITLCDLPVLGHLQWSCVVPALKFL